MRGGTWLTVSTFHSFSIFIYSGGKRISQLLVAKWKCFFDSLVLV